MTLIVLATKTVIGNPICRGSALGNALADVSKNLMHRPVSQISFEELQTQTKLEVN